MAWFMRVLVSAMFITVAIGSAFLECAPEGGQFQAAFLTDCWAWRSSYCTGLR